MSLLRVSTRHRYEAVAPPAAPDPPAEPPPDDPEEKLYWAESRSVYDVPFESSLIAPDSIWTRPIGDSATYVNPNFGFENGWNPHSWTYGVVTADREHIFMNPSDPTKTLTVTDAGPGNGQTVHVPASESHNGSLNGCSALLRQDNPFTIWQGQPLSLTAGGNPSWRWTIPTGVSTPIDLRDGSAATHVGSHGGSRLSTVAGSIRPGVINGSGEINHPLKLNVHAVKYLYREGADNPTGFRWPAQAADAGWKTSGGVDYYGGTVSACRIGALVAIPPDTDTTFASEPRAAKMARCLKYYGAYIVDNTAWSVYAFSVDKLAMVSGQWTQENTTADRNFNEQVHQLITLLQVVDNNAPGQTCAGGGDPLADNLFAPPVDQ